MVTGLGINLRFHAGTVPVVLGLEDEDDYLQRRLSQPDLHFYWYRDFQYINRNLPPTSKILIWDTRGFYLDRDYEWAQEVAGRILEPGRLDEVGYVLGKLEELGISHVAFRATDVQPDASNPSERLRYTLATSGCLDPVYTSDSMKLYRIRCDAKTTDPMDLQAGLE